MVRYRSSVVVPYVREKVWKLMSDWRNLAIWDVNIKKSQLAEDQTGPIGMGTKYDCTFSMGSYDMDVNYECVLFDAPRKCQHLGFATLFRSRDTIECEPVVGDADKTRITAEFDLSFRSVLAPLSFVMKGAMDKTGPVVMKDIEQFVQKRLQE